MASLLAVFLLAGCGVKSDCPPQSSSMTKTYSGCDLPLIPADNWAMLQNGQAFGQYFRKDDQIFWKGDVDQKIENVDVESFMVNAKSPKFARDKNHVYENGVKIEGAYPGSFQFTGDEG